jgi:hypothetical protein
LIFKKNDDIIKSSNEREVRKMIKIIKNLFSNKKNEKENNINDLFSDIDNLNSSLLEKNQKMISSYYDNKNH